jgi:hypothetical protein
MESDQETKVWLKLPGETRSAYQAFAIYRDIYYESDKPGHRSYQLVADKLAKSVVLIKRWGSKYNWVERVDAYDQYLENLRQEAITYAKQTMATRHIKIISTGLDMAEEVLEKMQEDMHKFYGENERPMNPKDAAKFVETLIKLERLTLGEATDKTDIDTICVKLKGALEGEAEEADSDEV